MDEDNSDIFVHFDDIQKANITKDILRGAKNGQVVRLEFSCMNYIGKYKESRKAVNLQLIEDTSWLTNYHASTTAHVCQSKHPQRRDSSTAYSSCAVLNSRLLVAEFLQPANRSHDLGIYSLANLLVRFTSDSSRLALKLPHASLSLHQWMDISSAFN